jgi:hypothetical protein
LRRISPVWLDEKLGCGREFSLYLEIGRIGEVIWRLVIEQKIDLVVTNRGHLQHPKAANARVRNCVAIPLPGFEPRDGAKITSEKKNHMVLQTV